MSVVNIIQLIFSILNPQNDNFLKLFYIYQRVVIFVLFLFQMVVKIHNKKCKCVPAGRNFKIEKENLKQTPTTMCVCVCVCVCVCIYIYIYI